MTRTASSGPDPRLRSVVLVFLVLLAGCSAPISAPAPEDGGGGGVGTADASPAASAGDRSDPATDRIGWEDGYWYDERIDVDQSDGLTDAEMEAYVARAMARVEYLRQREFTSSVPVHVISREAYRNRTRSSAANASRGDFAEWNNQVWEALFISGETENVQSQLGAAQSSAVVGFYSPRDDEIKLITSDPNDPVIDNATLMHELVHALQDQHENLSSEAFRGRTQDGDLAIDGLLEGEAKYIEAKYEARCDGEWQCVRTPKSGGSGGGGAPNLGILLTMYQPYSDGPVYVHDLVRDGGWDAVNAKYDDPPTSSEQIIHRTDEEPVPIEFRDRGRNGWGLVEGQGVEGSDTVGEASIYAMFWYQARTAGADTIDPRSLFDTTSQYDTYNYVSAPSAGWANDRVFPYRKGSGENAEFGYVWVTEWDTARDAREFAAAYRAILAAHDAVDRGDGVYVVESGPFADAFRVTRDGTRVTIVNGPRASDLDDVRPR